MIVDVVVGDLLRAATRRILTVNGQTAKRSFEHRVGLHVPEGCVSAIGALDFILLLAQVDELVATLFAEASPANSALDWLFKHIQADAAVKVVLDLVLGILGRQLAFEYCALSFDCHERFFIQVFPQNIVVRVVESCDGSESWLLVYLHFLGELLLENFQ